MGGGWASVRERHVCLRRGGLRQTGPRARRLFAFAEFTRQGHWSARACGEFHEPLARDYNRRDRATPAGRDLRSATMCRPRYGVGWVGYINMGWPDPAWKESRDKFSGAMPD